MLYQNLRRAAELRQEIKRFGSKRIPDIVFDSSDTESVRADLHTYGIDPILLPKRGAILDDLEA